MTNKKLKNGISAILVVYNEEKVIERCLKSLSGVVDEIILIHDGPCDDNTLEIAKKYTTRVFEGERKGMCELHYVDYLSKVKFNWVFRLDADEYMSKKLQKNIRTLIKREDYDAYTFLWKIWDGKKYISKDFPSKKSLFRMSKLFYIEFPHKEFETSGKILETKYVLEHKPLYNNYTLEKIQSKYKKWCSINAKYYLEKNLRSFQTTSKMMEEFHYKIKRQTKFSHHILCPFWAGYSFFKSFFKRGFYKNPRTWKVPFYQSIYGWYLCYYISIEKKK